MGKILINKTIYFPASHIHSTSRRKEREPIAYGYWGKNDVVPTSETDFLWVDKCFIKSNIPGNDPVELLNCMVDTGSEVVTIRDEILPQLDLRFVQTINSKGIHKVEEKPLYRGVLVMGGKDHGKEVEVDVSRMNFSACLINKLNWKYDDLSYSYFETGNARFLQLGGV